MNLNRLLPTAVLVLSIGTAAACAQVSQAQSESPAQIWHDLVACARTHGDPSMPDPTIDSQGQAHFPPGMPTPSQATQQACQSVYNRLPASLRNAGAPDIQMAIKFSQCMRQHGLTDWPDPNANGDYPLPPDLQTTSKSGPVWTRIKAAWDLCKAFNPSGHISVANG